MNIPIRISIYIYMYSFQNLYIYTCIYSQNFYLFEALKRAQCRVHTYIPIYIRFRIPKNTLYIHIFIPFQNFYIHIYIPFLSESVYVYIHIFLSKFLPVRGVLTSAVPCPALGPPPCGVPNFVKRALRVRQETY